MILYITNRKGAVLAEYSHFFDDKHDRQLDAGASTFEFSVKKANEDTSVLQSGNGVILRDNGGRDWFFVILSLEETQYQVKVSAEDASIELLNRMMDELPNTGAHPFSYYANQILDRTPWRINVDQTQGKVRALSYTGQDTGLGRLLSIAKGFDNVELAFRVRLAGLQIVDYYIDVVSQLGSNRSSEIQINYQAELNNITKTESRAKFATAMRGIGSTIQQEGTEQGPEVHVDFADVEYDDGEFRSPKGDRWVYAETANRKFNEQHGYIESLYSFDTGSSQELFNRTLAQLKIYSEPSVTYEADVKKIDSTLELGDMVRIIDHEFKNLYLQARVSELVLSYTDPSQNSVKFSNYEALTSNLDERIAFAVSQLPEQARYTWIRYAEDSSGKNMSPSPAGRKYIAMLFNQKSAVMSDDPNVYAGQWVKIVGSDGQVGPQGKDGEDGIAGKPGVDGRTQYTHIAYADNAQGGGFSENPSNKAFIGIYVDFNITDSAKPADYSWSLIKGADGANGTPGKTGADGKTPYFHTAYANSVDGKANFSITDSNRKYLGTLTDYTLADSTNPSDYSWSMIQGPQGANGAKGDNAYLHIAWADNVTGTQGFTTVGMLAANKLYMGTYSDGNASQSTDPTKYIWVLVKGPQGAPGSDNVPVITMGTSYPTTPAPKTGDMFWHKDNNGKVDGFFLYDAATKKWSPNSIQQSLLIINELDSVVINSGTINSPNITSPFSYKDATGAMFGGTFQIKDGQVLIDQLDSKKTFETVTKVNSSGYEMRGFGSSVPGTSQALPANYINISTTGIYTAQLPVGTTDRTHLQHSAITGTGIETGDQWETSELTARFLNYAQKQDNGGHAWSADMLSLSQDFPTGNVGGNYAADIYPVQAPEYMLLPNLQYPRMGWCVIYGTFKCSYAQPSWSTWRMFIINDGNIPNVFSGRNSTGYTFSNEGMVGTCYLDGQRQIQFSNFNSAENGYRHFQLEYPFQWGK